MKFFQILMIFVILGMNYYALLRLWNMIPAGGPWKGVFLGLAAVLVSCFFFSFFATGAFPVGWAGAVYRIGTSWFFIVLYLVLIFLVADLFRLFGLRSLGPLLRSNWTSLLVIGSLLVVVFTAGYWNYTNKKRTVLRLDASTYSGLQQSVRIVAVSDLHLGYGIGPGELAGWVDKINAENPDVVIIAGDLIDNGVRPLYHNHIAKLLNQIQSRYGVFLSPGNHEYYTGIQQSREFLSGTGITFLQDSVVLLPGGFYIAGRDDRTNKGRKPLGELLATRDAAYPVLLLDHQPYELEMAEQNRVFLQFSGHTHRGQVWPVSWITDRMYEVSYGYARKGNTHFYISSGLGIWGGKFRIGSRSEYVVIEMEK